MIFERSSHATLALAAAAMTLALGALATAGDAFGGDGQIDLQAGGIAVVKPKFEGSKDYKVVGAPIVGPAGGDGNGVVQFKGIDDLRFRLLDHAGFEAGPLVGYRFGRDEDDADGASTASVTSTAAVVAGGFVALRMGPSETVPVGYHHQVTGDDTGGSAGSARRGAAADVRASGFKVVATGGVTWADDDYMQSFIGVTAAQNAASGLARVRRGGRRQGRVPRACGRRADRRALVAEAFTAATRTCSETPPTARSSRPKANGRAASA